MITILSVMESDLRNRFQNLLRLANARKIHDKIPMGALQTTHPSSEFQKLQKYLQVLQLTQLHSVHQIRSQKRY